MRKRFLSVRLCRVVLLLVIMCLMTGYSPVNADGSSKITSPASGMSVHFIDAGQGDSTLITCGKEAMLIDAGDPDHGTAVQMYLKKQDVL